MPWPMSATHCIAPPGNSPPGNRGRTRNVTVIEQLRKHSRVAAVDDQRAKGNGVIVTLRKGWTFDPLRDNRVSGADTVNAVWTMVRHAHPFAGPWRDSQVTARAGVALASTAGGN
jgi:hypothetical protein